MKEVWAALDREVGSCMKVITWMGRLGHNVFFLVKELVKMNN